MRRSYFLIGLVLAIFGPRIAPAATSEFARDTDLIERVIALLDRRLALMPEVAAIKFRQGSPIADLARERDVIERSVTEARAIHLDAEAARTLFEVQIQMARSVQEQHIRSWQQGPDQPPPARDLVKQIRPELDEIGRELLPVVFLASAALTQTPVEALQIRIARLSRHPGISAGQLAELARALGTLRITAPATWDSIRKLGFLRVGTTGDYAPFSDDRGGALRGLDIELARSLAEAWGLRIVYVRTSWPTLMADLAAHRFDLAASGITVTAERERHADFSAPYLFDGKTPIARATDAARFSSLAGIDQPGVRVIVNPGGTNERFVRERIKHASILVHPDNRTIFDELVAGRADVMITDGVEVRLQERLRPALKGTMSEPLNRAGKAVMLPRGSELTVRVNASLAPRIESGDIDRALARVLAEVD